MHNVQIENIIWTLDDIKSKSKSPFQLPKKRKECSTLQENIEDNNELTPTLPLHDNAILRVYNIDKIDFTSAEEAGCNIK